jgi:AcrR family transcriptional regulator
MNTSVQKCVISFSHRQPTAASGDPLPMRSKTEERRQLILDVAAEVFREEGFEKASMAVISSRVGGSKATLYNYFPSKTELFLAMMEAAARARFEAVFTQLSHDEPLATVLQRFGLHYLRTTMSGELVSVLRMAQHEADRTEVGRLLFENGMSRTWDVAAQFLRDCMARGTLPEADAHVAAWHLKGLYEAELRDKRMLGVLLDVPTDEVLQPVVARAVVVWLRAYGVR